MTEVREIAGLPEAAGRRFGIAAARFHDTLVERLLRAALDCLDRHGAAAEDVVVVRAPGAWELPQALDALARAERFDALIALGAVVRGETPHFDYVAGGCSRGLSELAAAHRLPVAFGVLTCDDLKQAEARAGGDAGNKGWEAALAAIEMADLNRRLAGAEGS